MVERLRRGLGGTLVVLIGGCGMGGGRRGNHGETETRQLSPPGRNTREMIWYRREYSQKLDAETGCGCEARDGLPWGEGSLPTA